MSKEATKPNGGSKSIPVEEMSNDKIQQILSKYGIEINFFFAEDKTKNPEEKTATKVTDEIAEDGKSVRTIEYSEALEDILNGLSIPLKGKPRGKNKADKTR